MANRENEGAIGCFEMPRDLPKVGLSCEYYPDATSYVVKVKSGHGTDNGFEEGQMYATSLFKVIHSTKGPCEENIGRNFIMVPRYVIGDKEPIVGKEYIAYVVNILQESECKGVRQDGFCYPQFYNLGTVREVTRVMAKAYAVRTSHGSFFIQVIN